MIVIIDYGVGNLGSILNAFKKVGAKAIISSDLSDIEKAEKLVLPGVGAFDNGMKNLNDMGLIEILNNKVIKQKTPILGICLGMQLFTNKSEEGQLSGLGWIDGEVIKFKTNNELNKLRIPHMGWNNVQLRKSNNIFNNMYDEPRFYFVHSFYVNCVNEDDVLTTTDYGFSFTSSIQKENIVGTQFHPEKSHKFGLKIFKNFAEGF